MAMPPVSMWSRRTELIVTAIACGLFVMAVLVAVGLGIAVAMWDGVVR